MYQHYDDDFADESQIYRLVEPHRGVCQLCAHYIGRDYAKLVQILISIGRFLDVVWYDFSVERSYRMGT